MVEKYGLGEPLFDSPEANIEYAPDNIGRLGLPKLIIKVSSSSMGSAAIE